MEKEIPKWRIQKIEIFREGKLDEEYISDYELQKNGTMICKLSLESLKEVKDLTMPPHQENKEVCSYKGHDHGVNDCPYRKCEHNDIGRRVISHEGITHPAGNQLCLDCGQVGQLDVFKLHDRRVPRPTQ